MAEDKGKSGGAGGFVPGGADFGKAEKPGFGDAGKHEGGKPESEKPGDKIEKMRQRDGFKHEVKRDMFKQGIKPEGGVVEGEEATHKRHRRRRRRGKSEFQQESVKAEEIVKHQEFVKDEKKVEAVKPIEPESLPPELPVAPINPFSSFSPDLPPMSYETRYEDKNAGGRMENKAEEKSSDKREPIDTEIPVNPFETSIFPKEPLEEKPLDDKPLVNRPLEEKKGAEELEVSEKSSKKDYEEAKEDFSVKEREPWTASMPEVSVAKEGKEPPIVAEVIEAEAVPASMPEVKDVSGGTEKDDQMEEFKGEFFKVLESAGITKRKIVVFASLFAVAVIALLFFVFGWYKILIFWGDDVPEMPASEDVEEAGETGNIPDDSFGNIFGIVSSYIFGLEYQPAVENITAEPITTWGSLAGLDASFVFGEMGDFKKHRFSEYAELIRSLKNISETDVYKLLDLAVDRRAAINDHLNLMKELISKAESTAVFIESEIEMVRAEYMLLNDQRAVYEEQFFSEVQAMNGDSAYNSMEKFVDSSKQVVALKAYFSANQSILKLVNDYRNVLEPRYRDISVNIEALIKGVKVFEIPQSNIDAIIILNPPNQ